MFGFMKGAQGSPMSLMNDQQRLSALGSALRGDSAGLQGILAQIGGQSGPIANEEGEDISAAFGSSGGPAASTGILGQLMNGAPLGLPLRAMTGKRFGFGGR